MKEGRRVGGEEEKRKEKGKEGREGREERKEGGVTSYRSYRSPNFIVQPIHRCLGVRDFSTKCKVQLDSFGRHQEMVNIETCSCQL
jgi:hypothetical protein